MRQPPDLRWRLSRKPAATSIARWPRRSGMSGRVCPSSAGQGVSVTEGLTQKPGVPRLRGHGVDRAGGKKHPAACGRPRVADWVAVPAQLLDVAPDALLQAAAYWWYCSSALRVPERGVNVLCAQSAGSDVFGEPLGVGTDSLSFRDRGVRRSGGTLNGAPRPRGSNTAAGTTGAQCRSPGALSHSSPESFDHPGQPVRGLISVPVCVVNHLLPLPAPRAGRGAARAAGGSSRPRSRSGSWRWRAGRGRCCRGSGRRRGRATLRRRGWR